MSSLEKCLFSSCCLVLWPIFWLGHLFFWNWAAEAACVFLRWILCQLLHLLSFSPFLPFFLFCFIAVQSLCRVWLCDPVDCSTPGFPDLHHLLEFAQTHVHWFGDTIQPSYPLSPPSPLSLNLSQHQGLFQWVDPSHQVAEVLELQLQHQSFQWIFRVDFL